MSRYLIDQIARLANVRVLLGTEVTELLGDRELEAVVVEDNRTGARQTLEARSLFVLSA
jgi:thioredoxin reductase (NADPH)